LTRIIFDFAGRTTDVSISGSVSWDRFITPTIIKTFYWLVTADRAVRLSGYFRRLSAMAISPFVGFIQLLSAIAGVVVAWCFRASARIHPDRVPHQRAPPARSATGAGALTICRLSNKLTVILRCALLRASKDDPLALTTSFEARPRGSPPQDDGRARCSIPNY